MISWQRLKVLMGHEVRLALRDWMPIPVMLAFPVISMAFLKPAFRPALVEAGHRAANGSEQVVPGQAVIAAFFVVSLVAFSFFSEYSSATWDRLRASRAASIEVVLGKTLPRIVMTVVQLGIVIGAGVLLFDLDIRGGVGPLVPLVIAFAVCLAFMGVMVVALCRTAQQANAFAIVGMVLFGAIGGALVPYDVLPEWAKAIAPVTPTYWAMRGFRSVILDGNGIDGIAAPVGMLLAMAALFVLVALWRFRFDQQKVGWA